MSMGKRKRFSRDTNTWRMFEKLFLDTSNAGEAKRIGPFPKGKIVNLVQGLNCCNIQWAEEMQMPLNMLTLSAKAIRGTSDDNWFLEVSTNYRQQGLAAPSGKGSNWLSGLLASMPEASPSPTPRPLPTQGVGHSPLTGGGVGPQAELAQAEEEWVDPSAELLTAFLQGEKPKGGG